MPGKQTRHVRLNTSLQLARAPFQRDRRLRPQSLPDIGPALPRRHAPDHRTVNRWPTMAVRLTTGKTSKIRPYDGIATVGSENRQNQPSDMRAASRGKKGTNARLRSQCGQLET